MKAGEKKVTFKNLVSPRGRPKIADRRSSHIECEQSDLFKKTNENKKEAKKVRWIEMKEMPLY